MIGLSHPTPGLRANVPVADLHRYIQKLAIPAKRDSVVSRDAAIAMQLTPIGVFPFCEVAVDGNGPGHRLGGHAIQFPPVYQRAIALVVKP